MLLLSGRTRERVDDHREPRDVDIPGQAGFRWTAARYSPCRVPAFYHNEIVRIVWKPLQIWIIYARMMLLDVTARYNPFEAFLFDYFVAPAVFDTLSSFEDIILSKAEQGSRILDIGCGGGHLAIDLKRMNEGLHVTGLDLSITQLRRARSRSAKARVNVHLVRASALELPFPDESFDLVYSVDCLKHWPDKSKGLRECIRLIKPTGTLLITEVDRECTFRDGLRFVRTWNVPAILKPLSVIPFFMFAVLRSLRMGEVRALVESLPLEDVTIETGPAGINWTLKAVKPRHRSC